MQLKYEAATKLWIAQTHYTERDIAHDAGMTFDCLHTRWTSPDPLVAQSLREYADTATQALIDAAAAEAQAAKAAKEAAREGRITASRASDSTLDIPVPDGLAYLPYQRAGIEYAYNLKHALIADEPGLGKTIMALGIANMQLRTRDTVRILVVAPKIALWNWRREAEKWLVKPHTTALWTTKSQPESDIAIINYEILAKLRPSLMARTWDIIIYDEAHALKEGKAARTKAALGCQQEGAGPLMATRRLFLTGTPILNRPIELFTILNSMGMPEAGSFYSYAERYCDGHSTNFGYDARGSSNLEELQAKLRAGVMVRRLKADVLRDLAPKRYSVVQLEASTPALRKAIAAEQAAVTANAAAAPAKLAVAKARASGNAAELALAMKRLKAGPGVAFEEISRLRHETAVAKVPLVIEHLISLLEGSDESVLCMAHHVDVIAGIVEGLAKAGHQAAVITGDTSDLNRQRAQDDIQGRRKRIFVGSMRACGVAITLSAASTVVFAEQDWTPGVMTQAEDRAHRIGQQGSVLVQHLVVDGSMDVSMAQAVASKSGVIDAALDAQPVRAEEPRAADAPVQPAAVEVVEAPTPATAPDMAEELEEFIDQVVHQSLEHRPRGRPRQGEHAMTSTERSQVWRAKHDVKAITMPAELAARVNQLREERGESASAVLWAALDALGSKPRDGGGGPK